MTHRAADHRNRWNNHPGALPQSRLTRRRRCGDLKKIIARNKNPKPYGDLVCPPSFGALGQDAPDPRRKYLGEHRMTSLFDWSRANVSLGVAD